LDDLLAAARQGKQIMDGAARLALDEPSDEAAVAVDVLAMPTQRVVFPTTYRQMQRRWVVYKRAQDILLSGLIIAIVAVPLTAIAVAIKCDSRGPVFFRQQRRGLDGKLFCCLKFRTMHQRYCDPEAKVQSIRNDPRRTRIGHLLRVTSADELPQIFNVLVGHMSLIGPRPHAPGTNVAGQLLPDIHSDYLLRYRVKPGITGWAQVMGSRGILDSEEKLLQRLEHDFYYIANWSPLLDLRILLKTVKCLFDGQAF
jgi:lipopolysaccharide/colanic/teichoic acid biosynthesis glycosyltransferase